jgi:hypothetical protein
VFASGLAGRAETTAICLLSTVSEFVAVVAVAALPVMLELVRANVPAVAGSVISTFPLKAEWSGAFKAA